MNSKRFFTMGNLRARMLRNKENSDSRVRGDDPCAGLSRLEPNSMVTAADLGERGSAWRSHKPDTGILSVRVFIKTPCKDRRETLRSQADTHTRSASGSTGLSPSPRPDLRPRLSSWRP